MSDLAQRPIFAVTGRPGAGKTVFLMRLLHILKERGVRVGGVLQPRVPSAGERDDYHLRDVASGVEIHFLHFDQREKLFHPEGFAFAHRVFAEIHDAQVLFADELGHLESQQKGHWPALQIALAQNPRALLACSLAKRRLDTFRMLLPPFHLLDLEEPHAPVDAYLAQILHAVRAAHEQTQPPSRGDKRLCRLKRRDSNSLQK